MSRAGGLNLNDRCTWKVIIAVIHTWSLAEHHMALWVYLLFSVKGSYCNSQLTL